MLQMVIQASSRAGFKQELFSLQPLQIELVKSVKKLSITKNPTGGSLS
jgi:hypothetical protein